MFGGAWAVGVHTYQGPPLHPPIDTSVSRLDKGQAADCEMERGNNRLVSVPIVVPLLTPIIIPITSRCTLKPTDIAAGIKIRGRDIKVNYQILVS